MILCRSRRWILNAWYDFVSVMLGLLIEHANMGSCAWVVQVLASPNSSVVWIRYMAFQLSITEIEGARAVAERALKAISFRDEQEKMNIWYARGCNCLVRLLFPV